MIFMAFLFKRLNISLLLPVILLIVFSLLTLASLSANDEPAFQIFKKQVVWVLLGLGVFFILSNFFDHRLLYTQNFFSVGAHPSTHEFTPIKCLALGTSLNISSRYVKT